MDAASIQRLVQRPPTASGRLDASRRVAEDLAALFASACHATKLLGKLISTLYVVPFYSNLSLYIVRTYSKKKMDSFIANILPLS